MKFLFKYFLPLWLVCLHSSQSSAHEIRPAFLVLQQIQLNATDADNLIYFEVTWKKPALNGKQFSIYPTLPESCQSLTPKTSSIQPGAIIQKWRVACDIGLYQHQNIHIEGLAATITDVLVNVNWIKQQNLTFLLNAKRTLIQLADSADDSYNSFFEIGLKHLLSGYDHILFILLLLLLVDKLKKLIYILTSFTIAHSITLALASMNLIQLNPNLVEALITLSLIFLSIEVFLKTKHTETSITKPMILAFFFGLIHGLGLAANFQTLVQHQRSFIYALLFFNLGIEFGQVLIVALALGFFLTINRFNQLPIWLSEKAVFTTGSLSVYWFLQNLQVLFYTT